MEVFNFMDIDSDSSEALFGGEDVQEEPKQEEAPEEGKEEKSDEGIIDPNALFEATETQEEEGGTSEEPIKTSEEGSPTNFYSSLTKALVDDGVLTSLPEDFKAESPDDFIKAIRAEVESQLNETQRRIQEALDYGVEPSEVSKNENIINYLQSVKDEALTAEGEEAEGLRKNLIYQDYVNRGYSHDRALREVNKSINGGTDIEDAKEALKSNLDFFKSSYNELIKQAKEEEEALVAKQQAIAEEVRKGILDSSDVLGSIKLDKSIREKAFNVITNPVYTDKETGQRLTEFQKYQKENYVDYIKNVSLLFALTDGFKNVDKLVAPKVKNEVKSSISKLEKVIQTPGTLDEGNLKFASGTSQNSKGLSIMLDI